MKRFVAADSKLFFLFFSILLSIPSFAAESASTMVKPKGFLQNCLDIFKFYGGGNYKKRNLPERKLELTNDIDYLTQLRHQSEFGLIQTRFVPELDTRLYFSGTATPNENGQLPVVDPYAKALFVYFHGSGTENGTGANFNIKGTRMARLGYATLAFDYPFHHDGSINPKNSFADHWFENIRSIIDTVRNPNQPVYLVGHSFGVDVALEYLFRYPKSVDGAVALSPAGFDKETMNWYKTKTMLMVKSFPHFVFNELGARWAGLVRRSFLWNRPEKSKRPKDPTLINPNLKVRVVSGEWEEFIPGPLEENGLPAKKPRTYDVKANIKKMIQAADVHVEPGVGHLLLSHTDGEGNDLITRELLKISGEDVGNISKLQSDFGTRNDLKPEQKNLRTYATEPIFKTWIDEAYGIDTLKNHLVNQDRSSAQAIAARYKRMRKYRDELLFKNIQSTQAWAPEFYQEFQEILEGRKKENFEPMYDAFLELLQKATPHQRKTYGSINSDWKSGIPEPELKLAAEASGIPKEKPTTEAVLQEILGTEISDPAFFQENKSLIEAAHENQKKRGALIAKYMSYKKNRGN